MIQHKRLYMLTAIITIALSSTHIPVLAQQDEQRGFIVGVFDVFPMLNTSVEHDDNIFRRGSSIDEDTITILSPSLTVLFDNGVSGIELSYQADASYYSQQTSDDTVDQDLAALLGWSPRPVHRIEFDLSQEYRSDDRSADAISQPENQDVPDIDVDLDEYQDTHYEAIYTYGGEQARLGFALKGGLFEREYQTNRSITDDFDYERVSAGLGIFWRLRSDVELSLSASQNDTEYANRLDEDGTIRDNQEALYDVSLRWAGGASFLNVISYGINDRSSEATTVDSDTRLSRWDVSIHWMPLTFTSVIFEASRSQNEPDTADATLVDIEAYSVSWNHDWTSRASAVLDLGREQSEYEDSNREITRFLYSLSFNYEVNRWLDLSLFVRREDREFNSGQTNGIDTDFASNQYGLTLSMNP